MGGAERGFERVAHGLIKARALGCAEFEKREEFFDYLRLNWASEGFGDECVEDSFGVGFGGS